MQATDLTIGKLYTKQVLLEANKKWNSQWVEKEIKIISQSIIKYHLFLTKKSYKISIYLSLKKIIYVYEMNQHNTNYRAGNIGHDGFPGIME